MPKPTAIICDIDGVLCDSSERFQKINFQAKENGDHHAFIKSLVNYSSDTSTDKIIPLGECLLKALVRELKPDYTLFLTARGSGGRDGTIQWLNKHGMMVDPDRERLIMRSPQDEGVADHVYKSKALAKIMKKYNPLVAIDDKYLNIEIFKLCNIPTIHFKIPNLGEL